MIRSRPPSEELPRKASRGLEAALADLAIRSLSQSPTMVGAAPKIAANAT